MKKLLTTIGLVLFTFCAMSQAPVLRHAFTTNSATIVSNIVSSLGSGSQTPWISDIDGATKMATNIGRILIQTNGSQVNITNGTLQISNALASAAGTIAGSNVFQIDNVNTKKTFQHNTNGVTTLASNLVVNAPGTMTGNGVGVTNVWIKQTIYGSLSGIMETGSKFSNPHGRVAAVGSSSLLSASLRPIGGYLTNLQVWTGTSWPSTTNVIVTIYTNVGVGNPLVATPLTCTLVPAASGVFTNSGSTFVANPESQHATGYTWVLNLNTTSSGGNLAASSFSWSVDHYYQTKGPP